MQRSIFGSATTDCSRESPPKRGFGSMAVMSQLRYNASACCGGNIVDILARDADKFNRPDILMSPRATQAMLNAGALIGATMKVDNYGLRPAFEHGSSTMKTALVLGVILLLVGCSKSESMYHGKSESYWRPNVRAPDPKTREEAITALGALKAKDSIPDLIEALKDKNSVIRAKAAGALWGFGPDAMAAGPSLIPLLKDKDTGVRLNAAGALGEIGVDSKDALPPLREALRDRDVYVRAQGASSIGKFVQQSKVTVPILIEALRDPAKEVRVAAAYALAGLGPDARLAAVELKKAATEKDGDVRTAATIALRAVQGNR